MTWALLTGEYPPQPGGVADYTRALARALAAGGDDVHVFAPPSPRGVDDVDGGRVVVHRLPDHFGGDGRRFVRARLALLPEPRAAVVQYVPQAFGMRGCNVPFARWLAKLSGYPLFVMFHEVSVTVGAGTPLKYRIQALATRLMARNAIAAGDRLFVSTPTWNARLRQLAPAVADATWTPVPSNVGLTGDPLAVAHVRERYAEGGRVLLGHFGTYRETWTREQLVQLLPGALGPARSMLFLGRGSERFVEDARAQLPQLADRIFAAGELPPDAVAAHVAACDVLVQPFEDGVSARRGSVTAALALGVPVVTTSGWATEPLWEQSGAVALAAPGAADALIAGVNGLLRDAGARAALAARSRRLYAQQFAVEHTVAALRDALRARAASPLAVGGG